MLLFVALATVVVDFLTTLRAWLTSKKVVTAVATCAAAWLLRHNVTADPVMISGLYLAGITTILGFALADHGKEAAKINAGAKVTTSSTTPDGTTVSTVTPVAPNPAANPAVNPVPVNAPATKGFVRLSLALAIVLGGSVLGGLALASCGSSFTGKGAAKDALNCAAPSAIQAIKDFGPAVDTAVVSQLQDDGKLIKPTLESMMVSLVSDEAKCVGLNSLAKLLTPAAPVAGAAASSPRGVDRDDVRAELEKMMTTLAPNREVVLPGATQ